MSQNNPSQQFGVGNMKMWQQQMVYKQLKELQRQQQLQQFDQGARHQNLQSHSSVTAKPAVANQLPLMMNEMPINNSSNFMWVNNFAGGVPPFANNSQMVNTGNLDWTQSSGSLAMRNVGMHNVANGLMLSHEQSPLTRSMGYVPQQTDQSFYGMPVSSSRQFGNQYSQLLGVPSDSTHQMNDRAVNHTEKALGPFNSFQYNQNFPSEVPPLDRNNPQNFQGKSFYSSAPTEMLNGDFQQMRSNLQMSTPVQNSQSRQNFNSHEQPTTPVSISGSVTTLDPTEQKILFGVDGDDDWGTSFSGSLGIATGGYQHGSLENGSSGGFPSIHSGSWSALMQEAVQATSSEKGLQEEWSGLTLQTMEQPTLKNLVVSDDNRKQLAAWGDNQKPAASSLISKSLPLFNNAESNLGSANVTRFQQSLISTGGENEKIQNEDPNISFQLSSDEDRNKQFNEVYKHKHLFEGDLQVQTSAPNGAWAAQSYQQQGITSTDILSLQDACTHQQNLPSSSVHRSTSNFYDNSGNIWGEGQNADNLNRETQSLKPNVHGPEMKPEDPVIGNFGPIVNSNTMTMNQQMNQNAANSRQVIFGTNFSLNSPMNDKDESGVRNKSHTNQMPEKWDRPFTTNGKELAAQKKNENQNDISGEGRVPNRSSDGHNNTNMASVAKGSSISAFYNQNPFILGNQKSGNETSQINIAPKLVQDPFANSGNSPQHSIPLNHQLNNPGFANFRNNDRGHVEKVNSTGHVQCAALLKGVEMGVVEGNTNSVNSSGSCAGSPARYFQNCKNAYSSQNMLELLHKVDQSKSSSAGAASDANGQAVESESSQPIQSTTIQGYGLRLAPPAQWQSFPSYGFPQTINDADNRQLDMEMDSKDQTGSDAALPLKSYSHEASHSDNSDSLSDMSKQQHMVTQDLPKQYASSPATLSKVPFVHNQLEDQNLRLQHYETGTRNQVEPQQHQKAKHNSISSRLEAFSSAGVTSATTHAVADLVYRGNIKQPGPAISHPNNLIQQLPIAGARSGIHPSLSGISQQPASSKVLHNVWAKLSAQQRLAGIQPHKITPQLLQSIINSTEGAGLRGLQKETNQLNRGENVSSETGISPGNSQNEENETGGESSTVSHAEKVAATSKTGITSHWPETYHPHQQDVKSRKAEDSSVNTHQMLPPATASTTSSSHLGVSQHMLIASSQCQSYSLLHQMQAMKDGDSDSSKLLGKRLSSDLGCSASQDWNAIQGVVYGQNQPSKIPLEGNGDAASQPLQSQHNALRFIPKNDEEIVNTSAGRHTGMPNQMHSLTQSSSNLIGGIELPQISPQMAPAWFEKYGNNQNGLLVASYDGQKSINVAAHSYFRPRIPGSTVNSAMVEQKTESCLEGTTGHGTLGPTISAVESSRCYVLPSGSDHGMVIRPKKRKIAASDSLPWHKVVTSGARSFQSISMSEEEWAQVTNRLMEQMDDESESVNDFRLASQPQKRLILTTKLMQHLLPAESYRMLNVEAADGYESLVFCVTKSALADACGLLHSTDSSVFSDQNNTIPKKLKTCARMEESTLLKITEGFIGKLEKLENDLQRSDMRTSLLDLRLECQEIERFAIVNRLGKFHGRPQSEGVEISSTSEASMRKSFPQRHITAISVSGNLPENVPCLSL